MSHINYNKVSKVSLLALLTATISLTACETMKSGESTASNPQFSQHQHYLNAQENIDKKRYIPASNELKKLHQFYGRGDIASKALLDLIYVEYQRGNFEEAIDYAKEFIRTYPHHNQVDYAYYVVGVANMVQANGTTLFASDQSERDTSYYRIAFASFANLISKYPNSYYASDSAQRMTYIYNQFARHELHIARYYLKRKAYVASVNRAKWVFQYYPRSQSVPEAIAILAYSYQQLGMTDLANEYKQLLTINYPHWLTPTGEINVNNKEDTSLLQKFTFNQLNKADQGQNLSVRNQAPPQMVTDARQLQLP